MIILTPNQQKKVCICSRYMIYFILTVGFAYLIRYIASVYQEKTFVEFGIIENMQVGLLLLSLFSFLIQSFFLKEHRSLLVFFASLCCFASIRELDSYFEHIMPFVSWKFCYLFPLSSLLYLVYDRIQAKKSLFSFIGTPAFSIMSTAMFIFIAVAQVVGNKAFIAYAIPELDHVAIVRRFIEEGTEVIAYFLLLLSTIEFYISMKSQDNSDD